MIANQTMTLSEKASDLVRRRYLLDAARMRCVIREQWDMANIWRTHFISLGVKLNALYTAPEYLP